MSEQAGDAATAAWACAPLGAIHLVAGDVDGAHEILQAGVDFGRTAGDARILGVALGNLAELPRAQHQYTPAAVLYQEGVLQARLAGDPHLEAGVLGGLAQAVALQGDHRRAADLLVRSLDLADELGEVRRCAINVEAFAALLALAGRPVDAARLFGATQAWRDRYGWRREPSDAVLHAVGLESARAALGPIAMAAAQAEGEAFSLPRAMAYARALTSHLHATPGRRPARSVVQPTSDARLTRREREVAELLGADRSNREIADRLSISEGTVRIHVANILSKLGLRSRHQVATRTEQ